MDTSVKEKKAKPALQSINEPYEKERERLQPIGSTETGTAQSKQPIKSEEGD